MINNVILIYPSYERGGVKKNFLSYIKALKKNNLKINIISDKNILRDVKSDNKIKIHIIKNFKSRLFYKYFTSLFSSYKLYQLRKINDKEKTRVISFQSSFFTSIVSSICGLKLIIRVSEDPIGATIHSDNRMSSFLVMLTKIITYNLCYKILVNSKSLESRKKDYPHVENVSFDDLISKSDIISFHCKAAADGKPMLTKENFKKMKPTSYIINAARGNIIDENDLNDALNENLIAGAAVDVFSKEPAKENILFNNPKAVLTPHIAASTTEASIVVAEMVANQISDFLLNGKKINTV